MWGQMDAFGHVNNTVYFRYFESARIAYFDAMSMEALMARLKIGPILGETACRFRIPLQYPDVVTVGARVAAVDFERGQLQMHYAVFSRHHGGRAAAVGDGLIVPFSYADQQRAPLPDAWLDAIRAIEQDIS
ncbi:MAG: acyl-CoA thioesterase [Candidatus Dadabacteria bacterium]|nr:MAG: acyl-CoA thioesterase [Candidatus Dadabacteria bacterium]